jgi:hypothetical protein
MASRRGAILILVLFVMVILNLVAVSFAYRAGLTRRRTTERVIMLRLQHQANSAAAIAMARIKAESNDFDHPAEPWHTHPPLAGDGWLQEWSADASGHGGQYVADYQVVDEDGKLNMLQASSEALKKLGMKESQINCLFDWMDQDDVARSEGAEDAYYESAKAYRCKNAPLEMLDELLLVRGFGAGDFYGEDDDHDQKLDPCENDGASNSPADNADGVLQLGWVDLITCLGDGRININTAPVGVLRTLPISDQAVEQIAGFRHFDEDSSDELESHAFRCPDDIMQLQGLNAAEREVLGMVGKFKSEHFRIYARARNPRTGLEYRLEVLVRARSEERPEVLQWKSGS